MNKPSPKDVAPPKVTTGALPGSRKVYSAPEGHDDLAVPFREIELAGGEPPFRVYDTSGPYTDPGMTHDVRAGLPRLRAPWIAKRSGGAASGASIVPSPLADGRVERDDRNLPPSANSLLQASCRLPRKGGRVGAAKRLAQHPVTQLELARAGIVTKEMAYVAHRENIGRAQCQPRRRKRASPTGRASARSLAGLRDA